MQETVNPMISEFLYDLPEELIARYPVLPYDSCRLQVMDLAKDEIAYSEFFHLPDFLGQNDLLVVNDTTVEKRRVFLKREDHLNRPGARLESVFLHPVSGAGDRKTWQVLIKKRQRLKDGEILFSEKMPGISFRVIKDEYNRVLLECPVDVTEQLFKEIGQMPIPPYLKREEEEVDIDAYQNPFSEKGGSVAAPTASLHFTPDLLEKIKSRGVQIANVTLNVGYGTFAPLKEENFRENRLHDEDYFISPDTARILSQRKYNKIYAVGTTALRVLETVYIKTSGRFDSQLEGSTDMFFHPPYEIKSVDGLITNFHLPGSSLMMLVACLCGRNRLKEAYEKAIEKKYRFFSYGDAMFIKK